LGTTEKENNGMSKRIGVQGFFSAAMVALALAIAAPGASASFGVKSWEAGTCKTDTPECTYSSPSSQFFTQAAGHPPVGLTDFVFNTGGLLGAPEDSVKDVRVDLPEGLNVDPQAVPQCAKSDFEANPSSCAASAVGTSYITSISSVLPTPLPFTVYNLVPDNGSPALFGFNVNVPLVINANVYLVADVATNSDYHEGFTISNVPNSIPLVENRLVFDGTKGGTFLTMGSQCNGPSTTGLKVDSYQNPGQFLSYSTKPPANIDGCKSVPFKPAVVASAGDTTDAPAAVTAEVQVPQKLQPVNSSTLKTASVTLPRTLGLNPSAANGLQSCSAAQFAKTTKSPATCPAASQIGTVSVQTPVLPANSLPGKVFLGPQESRDPNSGKEYQVFVDAESARYGLSVKLAGEVKADPQTAQLTATFANNPQIAFSSFKLQFNGGAKAPLTSPSTCGTNTTSGVISPWSGNAAATPSSALTGLTKAPGGGVCSKTMASRPFSPGFKAAPKATDAAAYTPFSAQITRADGQQELKGVDVTLPPGATAKLAGVPYCPASAIAAAAARPGAAEKKNSSCPDQSQVGVATVAAGSGTSPLQLTGKAFLAGPYKGAPLSLVVVTPAVAGPFDLGTVVVRVAISVDPETAQIHVVSDAIPDVFGGAKLDIRSINVNVNQKEFTLNGTNCSKFATAGSLKGGGADPTSPAAFSSFGVSAPSQLSGCDKLGFRPKLHLRLFGAHKRNKHPKLRAILQTRPGDANMARVSVGLPHALFLDETSLSTICTRVQFAAQQCPKKSIYGHATAVTPLLGQPLSGPVYLRSSNNELPDLVAHLEGQVDIDLVGRIDSFKGGIRTTFDSVPDVPVTKFTMNLPGGKHGLLVASKNLCKGKVKAIIQIKGQNGKKANKRTKLRAPCGKKKGHGKHKRHSK
jgi:hypothetical protein